MTAHTSAGAVAPATRLPGPAGQAVRPRFGRLATQTLELLRVVFVTIGSALDGLLVGLVVAYVVAVFVSGPAKYLGLPWPLEALLTAVGAIAIALFGAGAGLLARRVVLAVGAGIDRLLVPMSRHRRSFDGLRRLVAAPFGLVRQLPLAWLGAFAAILAVANLANDGVFGLFVPAGALGPYVILTGIVVALAAGARRLAIDGQPLESRRVAGPSSPGSSRLPLRRRVPIVVLGVAAAVIAGGGGVTMLDPGSTAGRIVGGAALDGIAPPPPTSLDDPGAPGPYAVRAVSYGSGTDRNRPAFGARVLATTSPVDASGALDPLGWGADEARELFWGFGVDELPLNGLAWLPVGDGPFPLVLMVHGNHAMGDFSAPGYAYLGEHLASRGFVAVSVDEEFLNGSWAGDWGGTEQLARAWFLLLHLDQWRTWNADPASPFFGLVDLDRVALIGHSRGGEAASVAAYLATRQVAPAPGLSRWPVGLEIRAVVAIAPSDGQFAGGPVVLRDTDFLTIHGGHDGDATSWLGLRQYTRTGVADGGFKAALWSYRSNHGQFNTTWGRSDQGPLGGAILNLAPLLDAEAQRDVASTSIGAFLEASLHGRLGYRGLFRRPMVGRDWLPADDIFLARSSDDAFVALTTGDPARGLGGTTVSGTGLTSQRSIAVPLRSLMPDQGTRAVELRWDAGSTDATWEVGAIQDLVRAADPVAIRFSLASGGPAPGDDAATAPLDLQVVAVTTDGVTVALPLSRWGALPPPLPVDLVKNGLLASLSQMDLALGAPPERVLQTYEIELAEFADADPAFDAAKLSAIRFLIDRSRPGAIWVSEVGLVRSR